MTGANREGTVLHRDRRPLPPQVQLRFVLALLLCAVGSTAGAAESWLTHAQLIDGTAAATVREVNVRIVDGHIAAITPAADRAHAIDLHDRFLLPGFIDAHSHIEDPAAARRALLSGVTTARVLGDAYMKAMATRDLIRGGYVQGPQLLVSGGIVRPMLGEPFVLSFPQFGRYYDHPLLGPDNVAEVVRALIARGVDVIKLGASERAGRADTDPRRQELSFEEMQAAVREATKAGLYVAAHAHDRNGANAAVRAGVRSIEHGTYLDDATLQLMKTRGTYFVPTLAIMSPLGDPRGDRADAIALQIRTLHMMRPLRDAVRKAKDLGITLAAGTDGTYGDGDDSSRVRPAHEIGELIGCGLTPIEAIAAATGNSARLLGIAGRTGTVAIGLEADLLVVDRDPRLDPTTLFEPMMIIEDGTIVTDRLFADR
jgi:imidazolonepropionase-like amidohydrolase